MILVRALGPVEVTVDGRAAPPELLWRKNLALLVYLARSPKRARAREHLIGLLWAEKPESAARHSLNEALRVLRHVAGEAGVETDATQVRLVGDSVGLDTDDLERLAAARSWPDAAALVSGGFLEGFAVPGAAAFEDWLMAERSLWRGRGVDVLVQRSVEVLANGDAAAAVGLAHRALALDPVSDTAARCGMKALAVGGDRAGALELFDVFSRRLGEELGTAPDGETAALAERVRRERVWRSSGAQTASVEPATSRRAPLVGREAELGAALHAWSECLRDGRAGLLVIEGEGGTGKTRLAEEVLARARLDGAVTVTVRGVEADREVPGGALLAVGGEGAGLLESPGLVGAPPEALAAFAAASPAWADRFDGALREEKGTSPPPPPVARALTAVLRAVTAEQPVLLLFDDAHWLDRESVLGLGAALRDLARAPLVVAVTLSPEPRRPELDELRSRIGRDLGGAAVRLGPLGRDGVLALARWAFPGYTDVERDRLARRVMTDSAGLPLLAVELLHAVALGAGGGATPKGGEARAAWPEAARTLDQTLPGELPDAVRAAVRVGFRRLSQAAQQVLVAAAVLGPRVPVAALGRSSGLNGAALDQALDELEWQRWLTAEPRGYAFVARVVRDIVEQDMVTPGQRQRLLGGAAGR